MAQITTVRMLDDLAKAEGREVEAERPAVQFEIGGKGYEIDLAEENYQRLRDVFAPYIQAARRVVRPRAAVHRGTSTRRPTVDREQNDAIRDWARSRGLPVSDRGRIPAEVLEAYHQEGPPAAPQPSDGAPVAARLAGYQEQRPAPKAAPPAAFIPAAKSEPVAAPTPAPERPRFPTKAAMNKAVREWAAGKGVRLAPRGSVPRDVVDQYVREHGQPVVG